MKSDMTDRKEIYLDNSATTRISEEALAVYCDISRTLYGNPSSLHELGFRAEQAMRTAEKQILASLGAKNATVIFTASGSEANNLAIFGRAYAKERYRRGAKILTTDGEHASVSSPLAKLENDGFRIVRIPSKGGALDLDFLEKEMTPDVVLVTMMAVNNETGARYDTAAVARIMKRQAPDALLHVDATQSYLKFQFTQGSCGADMLTLSSHKIEGPKGVGALVILDSVLKTRGIVPQILGGGQQSGLRSGTENVPGIAAFGKAAEIGFAALKEREARMYDLRKMLIGRLRADETLAEISVTEPPVFAPHIINITLPLIKSETMLHFLSSKGIYVSSGSACSSNSRHVSPALIAFGRSEKEADCSLRISLSFRNEERDIEALCSALKEGITTLARTVKK